jgi:hypothetical protein
MGRIISSKLKYISGEPYLSVPDEDIVRIKFDIYVFIMQFLQVAKQRCLDICALINL